jgi:hypothetical protein
MSIDERKTKYVDPLLRETEEFQTVVSKYVLLYGVKSFEELPYTQQEEVIWEAVRLRATNNADSLRLGQSGKNPENYRSEVVKTISAAMPGSNYRTKTYPN